MRTLALLSFLAVACGGAPNGDDGDPDPHVLPAAYVAALVAPPGTDPFMAPLGMNGSGEVVGYTGQEAWDVLARPARATAAGAIALDVPAAEQGFAYGISDSGTVVGVYQRVPQLWDTSGRHPLAVPAGWSSGIAFGISGAGTIAGSYGDYDDPPDPGPRPVTWADVEAEPVALPPLDVDGVVGAAFASNEAGQIAGASRASGQFVAVRWDSPTAAPTPFRPAEEFVLAEARGIGANGAVAGRVTFEDYSSTAWWAEDEDIELLPHHPDGVLTYAEAYDVSSWGHVVGMANAGEGVVHAVVWAEGELFDLNDRAGTLPEGVRYLSAAVAINDDGVIAAEAVMDSGFGDTVRNLVILQPED